MKFETLTQALDAHASLDKTLTYIAHDGSETVWTYQEMRERALNMLASLQARGLQQGDFVIFFLEDNLAFIEAFWACLYGGMVPVPVSSGPTAEHLHKVLKVAEQFDQPWLYTHDNLQQHLLEYAAKHDDSSYDQLAERTLLVGQIEACEAAPVLAEATPDSLAFIQFSSGSTSAPKGVVLSHANLIINSIAIAKGGNYQDDDKTLSWMPLTHDMGLIGFHITPLLRNVSQINMRAETFSRHPLMWLDKVSEHKASVLCSPNFGFKHYLKRLGDDLPAHLDLSCVRIIYNGAEPISVPLCEEFLEHMGEYGLKDTTMFTVYGLAEATLAVAFPEAETRFSYISVDRNKLHPEDEVQYVDRDAEEALHFVNVGGAIDDIEFSIQNAGGDILGDSRVGSICIKGPSVTSGYFNNDEANARAFRANGWLDTGDLGFTLNGNLYITGREKDIIFSNGLNYYPHDLEALSGVELGKVAFCGVREKDADDDTILGFVHVRSADGFIELAQQVKRRVNESTGLAVKHVLPIEQMPRTTSGKVQRARLAEAYLHGKFNDVIARIQSVTQGEAANDADSSGRSALELEIKAICDEVIEEAKLDFDDNFFDSGISSLSLAQVHEEIDQRYPDKIDITDFFDYPSIAEIATYLQEKL